MGREEREGKEERKEGRIRMEDVKGGREKEGERGRGDEERDKGVRNFVLPKYFIIFKNFTITANYLSSVIL